MSSEKTSPPSARPQHPPSVSSSPVDEKTQDSTISSPPPTKTYRWYQRPIPSPNGGAKDAVAVEMGKGEGGQKEAARPVGFLELFRFATKREIVLNVLGLVASVAAGSAQPLMTLIFGRLTSSLVSFTLILNELAKSPDDAALLSRFIDAQRQLKHSAASNTLYLFIIGFGVFFCTWIFMGTWVWTGEIASKRIRERYLRAVLRQDVAFFDGLGAGEVTTRIQTDTHLIQQGISEKVPLAVSAVATFATGFVIAYIRSWRLALALSSILPTIVGTGLFIGMLVSKYMQVSLGHMADGGNLAEEVISSIRTVQAFSSQKKLASMFDKHVHAAQRSGLKVSLVLAFGLATMFFTIYASYALSFAFGGILISQGRADAGVVVTCFLAILVGSFAVAEVNPQLQAISVARGAASKLYQALDRVPTIDSLSPGGLKPDAVAGDIQFDDVVFDYPSREGVPVLKGLTVHFAAGKTTALVGSSGSGKSTIVALIERFYDPVSGTVRLDGRDIKTLNVTWLREQIGLVSQEASLFAMTVRANVELGLIGTSHEHSSPEAKLALVKEACIKANADGFISALPEGYETDVGERGMLLSGGQKQRVAIARAIVSDPKILLLDESSSALDSTSEAVVQDALDKASKGRTTITIAHRLATIKDADKILVMGGGEILESGSHLELIANPGGPYSVLVEAQKLAKSNEDGATTFQSPRGPDRRGSITDDAKGIFLDATSKEEASTPHQLDSDGPPVVSRIVGYPTIALKFWTLNHDSHHHYLIGFVASLLCGAVYPCFGVLYARGINGFSLPSDEEIKSTSLRWALYFFIMSILAGISTGVQNYSLIQASESLTAKIRSLSFRAILRSDVSWFDEEKNSTGAITSSLSENAWKIKGLCGMTLGSILTSSATVLAGCIVGLVYSWKLALVGIACIPFVITAGYVRLKIVVLKDEKNRILHEESSQLACEAAGAIRTVASLTREVDAVETYSRSLSIPLQAAKKTLFFSNGLYALSQSLSFFAIALVFFVGSRWIADLTLSLTAFYTTLMAVVFGAIQAGTVFSYVPDISQAQASSSVVLRLLDSRPKIDSESTEGKRLDRKSVQGHIRFANVSFSYPSRPSVRVLQGLDLDVAPGTYVALVGASGCGKSTTIQLALRFYDPLSGTITLDDTPISDLNVNSFREQVSLVSQEPTLFAGSIRWNILLGAVKPAEEITQEELEDACRSANISDFIDSLPDGFDTQVGGKGTMLSGGQKQRIAIARALIRNPKILLLDESSSALDSTSEKVVQDALDKASKGRTTIAIAHRLSTIQNADRIHFFSQGRITESGTHQQLLALKGGYYELSLMQSLSRND